MTTEPHDLQITETLRPPTLSVMEDLSVIEEAPGPLFPLAFRGYDKVEVEQHLDLLENQLGRMTETRNMLAAELEAARNALAVATAADREAGYPSYRQMGDRVAQIFTLAEDEVSALRSRAESDLDQARLSAEELISAARREGDEVILTSRKAAAEIEAERERRLAEIDAEVASARTAFETEASERREALDAELSATEAAAQQRLAEIQTRHDQVATELQALIGRINAATGG